MRQFVLNSSGASLALLGAALALSTCSPPHPHAREPLRAVASLDCPDTQGDLTRKSAAADGKSCVYATESGDQVTLQVVNLAGGDAQAALAPIETQLKAEVPAVVTASAGAGGATATTDGAPDKDRVDINLPGLHIHAHGDGHADIDTAGVHVHAHDNGSQNGDDRADVQVDGLGSKGVTVNANDSGAQIHVDEGGSGVRARYILASDTAGPHGYKVAGYIARGPTGGPIVVAEILAKSDDHDDIDHDVRELLRRNVGG